MVNKKRKFDQITKASPTDTVEVSPVTHVSNYFKKLKRAQEDDTGDISSDEEVQAQEVEENWVVRRDDQRYHEEVNDQVENNEEEDQREQSCAIINDLAQKYPGFRKSAAYTKLEEQSISLIEKTATMKTNCDTNLSALRNQMKETRARINQNAKATRIQAANYNLLSKHTRVQALSSNDRRIDEGETAKPITCHTSEADSDNVLVEAAGQITVADQVPCPEDD